MTTGYVPYRVRARVASINGAAPTGTFSWWIGYYLGGSPTQSLPSNVLYPNGHRMTNTETTTGTAFTPWITVSGTILDNAVYEYTKNSSPIYRNMHDILATTLICTPITKWTTIEGEIEATEAAGIVTFSAELFGNQLCLFTWRDPGTQTYVESNPQGNFNRNTWANSPAPVAGLHGTPKVGIIRQFHQRYMDLIATKIPVTQPLATLFHKTDNPAPGDHDRENWRGLLTILRKMGVSGMPLPPSFHHAQIKEFSDDVGMNKTSVHVYAPPGGAMAHHAAQAGETPQVPDAAGLADAALSMKNAITNIGWTVGQAAHLSISDEQGNWGFRWDPQYGIRDELAALQDGTFPHMRDANTWAATLQEFRDFLAAQGLTPGDVGHSGWSTVYPLGRSKWNGTLAERTLFYYSCYWFSYTSSRHFGRFTAALRVHFGDTIPITHNWNTGQGRFWLPCNLAEGNPVHPDSGSGSHDWQEHGRLSLMDEWYADYTYDKSGWINQIRQSRMDSGARKTSGRSSGFYWVAVYQGGAGLVIGGTTRKWFSAIGHGANFAGNYQFGGTHTTVDGYAEQMFRFPDMINGQIDTDNMVRATEADFFPAVPIRRDVAVVYPRGSFPWDAQMTGADRTNTQDGTKSNPLTANSDYLIDAQATWCGLNMLGWNPEWIEEFDLTASGLAPFKVIYLTGENLTPSQQSAVSTWVNNGGTVVTGIGAGKKNHLNDTLATVHGLGGLTEATRIRHTLTATGNMLPLTTVNGVGGGATVYGGEGSLPPADYRPAITAPSGTVEATWSDNASPAIVRIPVGSGFHHHFGFPLASSFTKEPFYAPASTALDGTDTLGSGWDSLLGTWLTRPLSLLSSVKRFITHGLTGVENPVRASSTKCLIYLINWNNASVVIPAGTRIRPVRADGTAMPVQSITSYRTGNLVFTNTADGITLNSPLTLQYADVLTVTSGDAPVLETTQSGWGMIPF